MSRDRDLWQALNEGSLSVNDLCPSVRAVQVRLFVDGSLGELTEDACDLLVHEFEREANPCIYDHCRPWSRCVREVADVADPVEGIGLVYEDDTTVSYLSHDPEALRRALGVLEALAHEVCAAVRQKHIHERQAEPPSPSVMDGTD